jgi:hypothetical protein
VVSVDKSKEFGCHLNGFESEPGKKCILKYVKIVCSVCGRILYIMYLQNKFCVLVHTYLKTKHNLFRREPFKWNFDMGQCVVYFT